MSKSVQAGLGLVYVDSMTRSLPLAVLYKAAGRLVCLRKGVLFQMLIAGYHEPANESLVHTSLQSATQLRSIATLFEPHKRS